MAKRGNNEASYWHNKKKGVWEAKITVGYKDGFRVYKLPDGGREERPARVPIRRKITAKTKKAAIAKVQTKLAELEAGEPVATSAMLEAQSVGDYLNDWIAGPPQSKSGGTIAPVTVQSYRRAIDLYVIPHIGHIPIRQLKPAHVEGMLKALRDDGKSGNTQTLARSVLRRALRRAEQHGLVDRNVAQIADGPSVDAKQGKTLTVDQAKSLIEYVTTPKEDPKEALKHNAILRQSAAWIVALSLGLRRGELLGLTWQNIDFERRTVHIDQSLKRLPKHGLIRSNPKTKTSRRTIYMPDTVAVSLRSHRATQAAERLIAGPEWDDRPLGVDLVFRSPMGTATDPDNFRQLTYRATLEALGERWSPHGLRHSAASILLAQGVPLKTISEILGHSSIRITADIYAHLGQPAMTEAATAMEAALFS